MTNTYYVVKEPNTIPRLTTTIDPWERVIYKTDLLNEASRVVAEWWKFNNTINLFNLPSNN